MAVIEPARVCMYPPCRGPRKCWQYEYCWYYGESPETLSDTGNNGEVMQALVARFARRNAAASRKLSEGR